MPKYYFTYGTDPEYPYRGGWSEVYAPNVQAVVKIFTVYHPNREDSGCINCADYYREESFVKTQMFEKGNFGARCHEIIGSFRTQRKVQDNDSE